MMNADVVVGSTQHDDLLGILVNTYRELNMSVRSIAEERLVSAGQDHTVRDIISRMRADEMKFAQALKQRVSKVVMNTEGDDRLHSAASEKDSTRMLISQFGTARETTLSLLKGIPDADWIQRIDDGETILEHVEQLAKSDQTQLQRIKQLLA